MEVTRAFVEACYRELLGREPESDSAVERHLKRSTDGWTLIREFALSDEFKTKSGFSMSHSLLKTRDPRYLASGLSEQARLDCFVHNYQALLAVMDGTVFRRLINEGIVVVGAIDDYAGLEIRAQMFTQSSREGEITLSLTFESHALAVLSFTVVPAAVFGLAGRSAILISRVQGRSGAAAETRRATRLMGDIAPSHILLHALEGIAAAHGIDRLVGVNAEAQTSFETAHAAHFLKSYDDLFISMGGEAMPSGFYVIHLPRASKPLNALPVGHRARTRLKRAKKKRILDAALAQWTHYLTGNADDRAVAKGLARFRDPTQTRTSTLDRIRSAFAWA